MTAVVKNFPAALLPIIQQGFLEREFLHAIRANPGYRACADRTTVSAGFGESVTENRAGLKQGAAVGGWGVERYTLTVNLYAATTDLNVVMERVGIASQFLQNAYINGEQAARSLDELARNVLFGAHLAGNTRVRATNSVRGPHLLVDDIRGFDLAPDEIGVLRHVSTALPLTVIVGANVYKAFGVQADTANLSTAPNGHSGSLLLDRNLEDGDAVAGNTVTAATASTIIRPAQRANTSQIQAHDILTMSDLLDAVAKLRRNAVPEIDGAYNCYLDPVSARQLFADPDFKQLFQGATSANQVFKRGMTNDFLGLRFVPTTKAFVQSHPTLSNMMIRRPMICGQGALVEGDFAGMAARDVAPADSIVHMVDGVAMVTREAVDRLQQIIAQSWYWIGGFAAPRDLECSASAVPSSENALHKRAVVIEHAG